MPIEVLSVASECAPLVKTGGLADVVGALPGALAPLGVRMRVLLPGYPSVLSALEGAEIVLEELDLMGGPARVLAGRAAGLDVLAIEALHLYQRPGGPYLDAQGRDWPDNPERFAALSWIAARIASGAAGPRPDVLHCHDWQAGLSPTYAREMGGAPSVMTIHNVAFQGWAPADRLAALRLPPARYTPEGFEFYGQISALKAGLVDAARITTVSPTYAEELLTPEFGMGLDGVLRARAADLSGILNGIDAAAHAPPFRDPRGKARHTAMLAEELGLPPGDGPLCVVVSRLTWQKGIDLLLEALPALLSGGGRLAVLGSGEPALEAALSRAAEDPRVALCLGYDEALARRMYAGGEAVLVPSRFEPCGLTQLYGLAHAAIPLVSRTGGLADTVIDANDAALRAGAATGLMAPPGDALGLARALARLCALGRTPHWPRMQRRAMAHPVGWEASAPAYRDLYAALTEPA